MEDKKRVIVKAWFDAFAWEGKVIGESSGDFGNRMLLVEPVNAVPAYGAAVWRNPDDCTPIN